MQLIYHSILRFDLETLFYFDISPFRSIILVTDIFLKEKKCFGIIYINYIYIPVLNPDLFLPLANAITPRLMILI